METWKLFFGLISSRIGQREKNVCLARNFLSGPEAEKITFSRFQDNKSPFRW